MKRSLISFLALCFAVSFVFSVSITSAESNVPVGTVVKGEGNPTLYFLGDDGKRYVFPNSNTYFSWFNDFSEVEEIPLEDLYTYPLGGNVRYKPGALLVKIQTDPKVYAVGENGKLRWLKSEAVAKSLYGENWNKLVDDVPDSFFTNYEVDEAVETEDDLDVVTLEEQVPTISHNRGFKPLVKAKIRNRNEVMCGRLEGALSRIQTRFERWGADITTEADEVLEKCYSINENIKEDLKNDRKISICHKGETLSVAPSAVKMHIRHGDSLGECTNDSIDDEGTDDSTDEVATTTDDTI